MAIESLSNIVRSSVSAFYSPLDAIGFDTGIAWNFDATDEGWTVTNGTITWSSLGGGSIVTTDNSSTLNSFINSPSGLSINGALYNRVKIGVTRLAGSGTSFNGALQYTTAGHPTFSVSFGKAVPSPVELQSIGVMTVIDWDMENLTAGGTDWITNTITQLRFILAGIPATDDQFRIHWIAVGRNAPVVKSAGGGGSPGGASGLIQYNNAGVFEGVTDVKSDGIDLLRVSDDSPIVFDADVRAGASNLNERIGNLANFSSPNAGGYVTGQFSDNNPHAGVGTLAGAANRIDMAPFFVSKSLTIDQIGCAVSTAVAASLFKVVIYSSSAAGWPDALLYESGDLSGAATGLVVATTSFTFQPGLKYWLGVRHSSTCTLRTIALTSAYSLGLTSGAGATQATIIRRTLTYATAATTPWNFVFSDLVVNVTPPSIRFRKA